MRSTPEKLKFFKGIQELHIKILTTLLETHKVGPAEINAKDQNGKTALHYVVGRYELPYILGFLSKIQLEKHGDIQNRALAVAKLLLTYDANVNLPNNEGQTALHIAIKIRANEFVELLLEHRADVNLPDNEGQTALHIAIKIRANEFVELLLKHNADVNLPDNKGQTALHIAAEDNNVFLMD